MQMVSESIDLTDGLLLVELKGIQKTLNDLYGQWRVMLSDEEHHREQIQHVPMNVFTEIRRELQEES